MFGSDFFFFCSSSLSEENEIGVKKKRQYKHSSHLKEEEKMPAACSLFFETKLSVCMRKKNAMHTFIELQAISISSPKNICIFGTELTAAAAGTLHI